MARPVSTFGFVVVIVLFLAVVAVVMSRREPATQPATPPAKTETEKRVAEAPTPPPSTTAPESTEPTTPATPEPQPPARRPEAPKPAQPAGEPVLTSLLGRPLYARQDGEDLEEAQAKLAQAQAEVAEDPDDPDKIIWVGRRLGYLWRMDEAIETFTEGIEKHPDYAPLYRHRGHRYISMRQFDLALEDLQKAAELIEGQPDEVEEDGMPNDRNIPLTTTAFNVWYHLGLTQYLTGDYQAAQQSFIECLKYTNDHDDNLVAVTDWLYSSYRRAGYDERANAILRIIREDMDIIENQAYHERVMLYRKLRSPDDLLGGGTDDEVDRATLAYGVGNWHLANGDADQAIKIFEDIVAGEAWPAFGFIAAEAELARMRKAGGGN